MAKLRFLVLLGLTIGVSIKLSAQRHPVYGLSGHYGWIIPHSSELQAISQSAPIGLQLDWSRVKTSERAWDSCNCYSQTGLAFNYFNYQNPDQLGSSYNLTYFAEPYLSYRKRLFFSLRAGAGITYLNRVHDPIDNPENTFYSSPVSFLLVIGPNANYRLTEKVTLMGGLHYNHISNGGMKQPNKGMNFPTMTVGVKYLPKPLDLQVREKRNDQKGQLGGYVRFFSTLPEVDLDTTSNVDNSREVLLGLSVGVLYHITHTNAFNVGVEVIRDGSYARTAEITGSAYDPYLVGLLVGHNFVFGKLTFNQQIGWYAYRNYPPMDRQFYQRYEILYRLGEQWQIGTSLIAHGHVAENLDLRLGYLIH
ncbi:MAG: acyloxyacyl hydrolase [Cyclobacteriaceae bacterium]